MYRKGGELVKIKNRTTKIKLELLPEEETKIDKVNNKDLYFPKQPKKIPKFTIPQDINNYNKSLLLIIHTLYKFLKHLGLLII